MSADETTPSQESETKPLEVLELLPGDFYMEGPYVVYTEQYHLRRGYCCNELIKKDIHQIRGPHATSGNLTILRFKARIKHTYFGPPRRDL